MNAEFFFNQGVEKVRFRNLTGAIDDFTKAIELSSGTVKKTISTDMGDGSIQHVNVFETSIGNLNMYFNRACAYMDLQNYDAAIYDLSKVIEYNAEDGEAYFKRAIANYCIENDEQKNVDLAMAFKLDPKYNHEFFLSAFGG